ncbi:hypothetical protein I7I53_08627 [Histoplasma capsulatum var. duboisii H88]|uniref:Uncharacterized protein n=1 Tax=Ajellomyces capsulatus (strain H88) TaxID=544711 RepID=A0A8A1LH76_AJEC8|nr:hypothetical protein I7I53_08627 [Histoplasma capsulatum var. duboisii H88]
MYVLYMYSVSRTNAEYKPSSCGPGECTYNERRIHGCEMHPQYITHILALIRRVGHRYFLDLQRGNLTTNRDEQLIDLPRSANIS